MSTANARLYGCTTTPCKECFDVVPRRGHPSPPHGDVTKKVDVLLVGLKPQLLDYRVRCVACGRVGRLREFHPQGWKVGGQLVCTSCRGAFADGDIDFVRPTVDEWTRQGLGLREDTAAVEWIRKRIVLDPTINVVNTRLCHWAAREENQIKFDGPALGNHLRDQITEWRPAVVVAYNKQAAEHLRSRYANGVRQEQRTFTTSGGKQKHVVSTIAPGMVNGPGGTKFGLIALSQAQTAPLSRDVDGKQMREWAGQLAMSWVGRA